jgi:hypothetical protein
MDMKAAAVLKVCYMGEFRRIPMEHRPSFDMVAEAVSNLYTAADGKAPTMKYLDEDGDLCTLVQATFSDFLTTARPPFPETDDINIRPLLKLQLVYETVQESITDKDRSDNTEHVEETPEVMETDLLLERADTPRQQLLGDRESHQQVLPDGDSMSEVSDTKSWEFVDLSPRSDGEVSADSKRRKVDESVSLQDGGQILPSMPPPPRRSAVQEPLQQPERDFGWWAENQDREFPRHIFFPILLPWLRVRSKRNPKNWYFFNPVTQQTTFNFSDAYKLNLPTSVEGWQAFQRYFVNVDSMTLLRSYSLKASCDASPILLVDRYTTGQLQAVGTPWLPSLNQMPRGPIMQTHMA